MLGFLRRLGSTAKWNDEAAQQQLVKMILQAAKNTAAGDLTFVNIREVFALQKANNWSYKETADRCVHAVSMIKLIADPRVYAAAKSDGERLYIALRS